MQKPLEFRLDFTCCLGGRHSSNVHFTNDVYQVELLDQDVLVVGQKLLWGYHPFLDDFENLIIGNSLAFYPAGDRGRTDLKVIEGQVLEVFGRIRQAKTLNHVRRTDAYC